MGRIGYLFDLDDGTEVAWVNTGPAGDVLGGDWIKVVETGDLTLAPQETTTGIVKEVRG